MKVRTKSSIIITIDQSLYQFIIMNSVEDIVAFVLLTSISLIRVPILSPQTNGLKSERKVVCEGLLSPGILL